MALMSTIFKRIRIMRLPVHRKSVYDAMFDTHSPEEHRRYYEKHWALHQKLVAQRLQILKEQSQQSQGQRDPEQQIPAQQIPARPASARPNLVQTKLAQIP